MFASVAPETQQWAKELLATPKPELYELYLEKYASAFVKAKTMRGKKQCFYLWRCHLENLSNGINI